MQSCNVDAGNYDAMLEIRPIKKLEGFIRDYIIYLREDREISPAIIVSYCTTIAHFYEMNDVIINWRNLKKFKGRYRGVVEDFPYLRNQIKTPR